jgi:ribosomal protein L34E
MDSSKSSRESRQLKNPSPPPNVIVLSSHALSTTGYRLCYAARMPGLGDPICSNCGYPLRGVTNSSVCPECGKPLVDVLVRKPTENTQGYKRFRSDFTIFGFPLVDIAYGPDPGERAGHAKGVIALGDNAIGLIAIGGFARGGLAIGGFAFGIVAFGGFAFGLGGANGGIALGGLAALGGAAMSGYFALGGIALGHTGSGGLFMQLW